MLRRLSKRSLASTGRRPLAPAICEHVFGRAMIGMMLRAHDIEGLRRSNAMAPLSQSHVCELIESCAAMAREREQIRNILAELSSPFGDVRKALNEMHRILEG